VASGCIFALLGYLALHQKNPTVDAWTSTRWTKQMAALVLATGVRDDAVLAGVSPSGPDVIDRAKTLRAHRLAVFALDLPEIDGRLTATSVSGEAECVGHFDMVAPIAPATGGKGLAVLGWAWDRRVHRPLTRIAIVDESGTVVGVALGGVPRPDVRQAIREVTADPVGWLGYARRGPGVLRALGLLDGRTGYCDLGTLMTPSLSTPAS
jgi:hypothetical protein